MPRRARIVAAGYPMHVILRGIDRAAVFFDDADRRYFLEWLGAAAAQESVAVHAYGEETGTDHVFLLDFEGKPGQTTLFPNSVKLTEKLSKNGLSPTPASASKSVRPASVGGRAVWVGLACPLEPNINTYSGNRHEPTRD
jgi:hypothetical protein